MYFLKIKLNCLEKTILTSSVFSVEPFSVCLGLASFSVSVLVLRTAANGFAAVEVGNALLVASSVVLPTWKDAGLNKLDLLVTDDEEVAAAKPDCNADGRSIPDLIGFERVIEFA